MIARALASKLKKCPAVVHMSITKRCNLNCASCYYRGTENPELVERIIEDLAASDVKAVAIGGGEPMMHPKIENFVKLLVESGKAVSITTNGTICRPIDGVSRYAISFDAIHGTTWVRPERAIAAAKSYSEAAEVWINHVLTSKKDLVRALDLMGDIADAVTLLALKPIRKIDDELWLEAVDIARQRGLKVAVDACAAKITGIGECRQGIVSMSIEADGSCAICSNDRRNRIPYTSLKESWMKISRTCPLDLPT